MKTRFSKISFWVLILSFIVFSQAQAANITFTSDVQLDFTSVPSTVYIKSGSVSDSLITSGSTLLADVPSGDTFTLKTTGYTALALTPSGGTVSLAFDTSYFTTGYVSQWTASSSVAAATVSFSIGVSAINTYYTIKVDGVNLRDYYSSSEGLVTFDYTGGFSSRTFTIIIPPSAVSPSYSYTPRDTTPPIINQITTLAGNTSTTISWKTDKSSISWLLYGTTTAYGSEIKTATSATSHSLNLTNLSASTTYHYQIKAQNSSGDVSSLIDKTFATLTLVKAPVEKVPVVEKVPIVKPVIKMTATELQAEIVRIIALIAQLQAELAKMVSAEKFAGIPAGFTFKTTLKSGMVSGEVKYLQIVLNSNSVTKVADSGPGSIGKETTKFGFMTKGAVVRFQEKYRSEILVPSGLTEGTGIVGSSTRAKLNKLLGK